MQLRLLPQDKGSYASLSHTRGSDISSLQCYMFLFFSPSPFHAVLLLKEADQITQSLPPETSSTFAKLISLVSPVKA